MNIEYTQDQNEAQSTGVRLRNAREQLGLSQQAVAERLCLKVSTVRDIEEDRSPADLASTFVRGYVRSYARLVHIPEEELLLILEKQAPIREAKVTPMQGFALGKPRKKRDGWLMGITWLVLCVVVGLTGAWWWQNHQAQQEEISSMANQSSAEFNTGNGNAQRVPLDNDTASTPVDNGSTPVEPQTPIDSAQPPATTSPAVTANQNSVVAPSQVNNVEPSTQPTARANSASQLPTDQAGVVGASADANALALVMNFNADCWLEVSDATGKKLFSGMQRKDATLNLTGQAPYKLKIGAPSAVQIQFQGKLVDLSRFIRTNQVARLTLNGEQSAAQ